MILLITFYVIGLFACALWGVITYKVGRDFNDMDDRRSGARYFLYSPLWPLLLAEVLRRMISAMRKDLS